MSILVTFNGSNYIIPTPNEVGWGTNLDNYFVAIAAGCLQKTGGSFTLSAETDFGSSFGIKSLYYKSRGSNIASTGVLRLNNNSDTISFRNAANSADLPLGVNASNELTFNGVPIAGPGTFNPSIAIVSDGAGSLISSTTTATEIGYLSGVTSSIQTQFTGKKTIATGNAYRFETTDNSGNLQETTVTASRAVATDTNGLPVASATTSTELGYVSGVTSAIQTQLNAKATDTLVVHLAGTETISGVKSFSAATGISMLNQSKIALFDSGSSHSVTIAARNTVANFDYFWPAAAPGVDGAILTGNLSDGHMFWSSNLVISQGGTGLNSLTAYAPLFGGTTTTGPLQQTGVGSSGQVMTSNGAGALPTFQNVAGTGTVNS